MNEWGYRKLGYPARVRDLLGPSACGTSGGLSETSHFNGTTTTERRWSVKRFGSLWAGDRTADAKPRKATAASGQVPGEPGGSSPAEISPRLLTRDRMSERQRCTCRP
jgi:hypothetical protein